MADDSQRNRTPSLVEVLRAALEQQLAEVYTVIPGTIDTYDAGKQKADVVPSLKRPLRDEDGLDIDAETLPVIPSVPVQFPRADIGGAGFFMSWPLKPGDPVLLHVAKWSLDAWLAGELGEPVDPIQFRQFNLSDVIAVPGVSPFKSAIAEADADNLVVGRDAGGMQLHLLPDDTAELRVGGVADVAVCVAETLQAFWDGTFKPKLDAFDAHVHATGVGPSGPPAPLIVAPAMDAAIISDKLKLKDNG